MPPPPDRNRAMTPGDTATRRGIAHPGLPASAAARSTPGSRTRPRPRGQTDIARRSPALRPQVATSSRESRLDLVSSESPIRGCRDRPTRRNSAIHRSVRRSGGGRLSSCRMRLRSTSGPRLALHEVLPLDLESEGTITVADRILIRPRRRDWSRPAGNAAFYVHPSGSRRFLQEREKPSLFSMLWQSPNRRPIPGLHPGRGEIQLLTTIGPS